MPDLDGYEDDLLFQALQLRAIASTLEEARRTKQTRQEREQNLAYCQERIEEAQRLLDRMIQDLGARSEGQPLGHEAVLHPDAIAIGADLIAERRPGRAVLRGRDVGDVGSPALPLDGGWCLVAVEAGLGRDAGQGLVPSLVGSGAVDSQDLPIPNTP